MEHATPKLDVAETKPDGNDILNKLRAPPVVADEAKLAIVFTYFFGPGVLACATRGSGRSEAGHCFHLLFFLFSFFFLRLLLFTHFGDTPEGEIFSPTHTFA